MEILITLTVLELNIRSIIEKRRDGCTLKEYYTGDTQNWKLATCRPVGKIKRKRRTWRAGFMLVRISTHFRFEITILVVMRRPTKTIAVHYWCAEHRTRNLQLFVFRTLSSKPIDDTACNWFKIHRDPWPDSAWIINTREITFRETENKKNPENSHLSS